MTQDTGYLRKKGVILLKLAIGPPTTFYIMATSFSQTAAAPKKTPFGI